MKVVYDPRLEGPEGMSWLVMDRATELGRFFNMARALHAFPAAGVDERSFAAFIEEQMTIAARRGTL